jgi:hypothetical protein
MTWTSAISEQTSATEAIGLKQELGSDEIGSVKQKKLKNTVLPTCAKAATYQQKL